MLNILDSILMYASPNGIFPNGISVVCTTCIIRG